MADIFFPGEGGEQFTNTSSDTYKEPFLEALRVIPLHVGPHILEGGGVRLDDDSVGQAEDALVAQLLLPPAHEIKEDLDVWPGIISALHLRGL